MTEKQERNRIKMRAEKIKIEKKRLKNKSILIKKLLLNNILQLEKFRLSEQEIIELQKLLEPACEWLSLQWVDRGGVANYRYDPVKIEW